MKLVRGLLPAAAAAMMSVPAFGQSSITIFGIADVGVTYGRGSTASRTQLTSGNSSTSRLGFRGREDLGGGMAASFWLESQVNMDNGTGSPANTNNQNSGPVPVCTATTTSTGTITCSVALAGTQGLTFNRRSTVSLHGGWGEIRLGRDYTPQFWNTLFSDPFGNVGVGTSLAATLSVLGSNATRASNSIGYFLPQGLGGVYGQLMHFRGENASTASDDGTGTGVRIGWAGLGLDVAASHTSINFAAGDQRTSSIYATYDFKAVQLWAHARWDRIGGTSPDGRGQILSAVAPFGPHVLKASVSRYRVESTTRPTSTKLALGYMYNLSKRTALYATYAHVKNKNGANLAIGGATTPANRSSTGYDLGIRHQF